MTRTALGILVLSVIGEGSLARMAILAVGILNFMAGILIITFSMDVGS